MSVKITCNVENVRKLADALEQGKIVAANGRPLGFNMYNWKERVTKKVPDHSGHHCGTVACIGGAAEVLFKVHSYSREAVLGLSDDDGFDLFQPREAIDSDDWTRIPLAAAVEVLRYLADKGKIDWPRAIKLHPLIEAQP